MCFVSLSCSCIMLLSYPPATNTHTKKISVLLANLTNFRCLEVTKNPTHPNQKQNYILSSNSIIMSVCDLGEIDGILACGPLFLGKCLNFVYPLPFHDFSPM